MNDVLKQIADNQLLFDALKRVIRKHFSLEDIGNTYDNETLGQLVRARIDGMKKCEEAFIEISQYATIKPKEEAKNPAR